jgi:hypothetical protein
MRKTTGKKFASLGGSEKQMGEDPASPSLDCSTGLLPKVALVAASSTLQSQLLRRESTIYAFGGKTLRPGVYPTHIRPPHVPLPDPSRSPVSPSDYTQVTLPPQDRK